MLSVTCYFSCTENFNVMLNICITIDDFCLFHVTTCPLVAWCSLHFLYKWLVKFAGEPNDYKFDFCLLCRSGHILLILLNTYPEMKNFFQQNFDSLACMLM